MNYFADIEEKISIWQSISDAKEILKKCTEMINSDTELQKKARLRVKIYPFKGLYDEYYPLIEFAESYYNNNFVKIRHTGMETQIKAMKYDGEVWLPDGTIHTIEIAKPINGEKYHKNAKQLNDNGYSIENGDAYDQENAIIEKIVETAKNKASKDYHDSILVFYPPDMNFYRGLDKELHQNLCERIKLLLKEITFNAKEVCVLLPSYHGSNGDIKAELIKIH